MTQEVKKVELEYLWDCHCGCGTPIHAILEVRPNYIAGKRGRRDHRTIKRRRFVVHHHQRARSVPAAPIAKLVKDYRAKHGLTWAEMRTLLGESKSQPRDIPYKKRIQRSRAERILRTLAGVPRLPSYAERKEAADRNRRERLERDAEKQRERRAARRAS